MKVTSKLPSRHLSADRPLQRLRGCFLGDNAAVPPAYRVKVEKCASFVDILDVCKFTTFCDRKGYRNGMSELSNKMPPNLARRTYVYTLPSKHRPISIYTLPHMHLHFSTREFAYNNLK